MLQSDAPQWGHRPDRAEEEKENAPLSPAGETSWADQRTEPSLDHQTAGTSETGEGEDEDGEGNETVGGADGL